MKCLIIVSPYLEGGGAEHVLLLQTEHLALIVPVTRVQDGAQLSRIQAGKKGDGNISGEGIPSTAMMAGKKKGRKA